MSPVAQRYQLRCPWCNRFAPFIIISSDSFKATEFSTICAGRARKPCGKSYVVKADDLPRFVIPVL